MEALLSSVSPTRDALLDIEAQIEALFVEHGSSDSHARAQLATVAAASSNCQCSCVDALFVEHGSADSMSELGGGPRHRSSDRSLVCRAWKRLRGLIGCMEALFVEHGSA